MNFNFVIAKATITFAVIASTTALSSPALAVNLKSVTKNTASVSAVTEKVVADVDETLNSTTEVTVPVPIEAQVGVQSNADVSAPPLAEASADVCVGVGVNAGAPGCPKSVPTPALLPGLIALGAGVLRKRNAGQSEA